MSDLLRAPDTLTELHPARRPPAPTAVDPTAVDPPVPRPAADHRISRPLERTTLLGLDLAVTLAAEAYALGAGHATLAAVLSCAIGAVLALACLGTHRPRLRLSALDDVPRLLGGAAAGSALALAVLWCLDPAAGQSGQLAPAITAAALGAVASRAAGYGLLRAARRRRRGDPALIIGTGVVAAHLSRSLLADRRYGLTPIGQVVSGPRYDDNPLATLGDVEDLPGCCGCSRPPTSWSPSPNSAKRT